MLENISTDPSSQSLNLFNLPVSNPLLTPYSFAQFNSNTGTLSLQGNESDNIITEWMNANGSINLNLDGAIISSDISSQYYNPILAGANSNTIQRINFTGDGGKDSLFISDSDFGLNVDIQADSLLRLNGNITSNGFLSISSNQLEISGTITAKNSTQGGMLQLLGDDISLDRASIDVSGINGGGTVLIGGDY